MTGEKAGETEPDESDLDREVDRAFTCTACGYTRTYAVPLLQRAVRGVCANCGGWTTQFADDNAILDSAREAADALAGDLLTERQALAYVLRDVLDVDRGTTAEAMDTSPSNVDNLQRRAAEKVVDARRVVAGLDVLQATD